MRKPQKTRNAHTGNRLAAVLIAGVLACALFTACDGGKRMAGGGSDIGNGSAIAGLALTTDGIPARSAIVRLRPKGYLTPLPPGAPKSGATGRDFVPDTLGDVRTDSQGKFTFAAIHPGAYRIEIADTARGQGALLDCLVDSGGKPVELAETRLTATGVLRIKAPAGAAAGTYGYVRLAGLERIARLDAGAELRLSDLPAGAFAIDVASKDAAIAALSGTPFLVRPGEETLFDSAAPPCGDRACDSLVLAAFLKTNGVDGPVSRFGQGSGRITGLVFTGLPEGYRFSTMRGLERLTAVATYRSEGPYYADSLMEPLMAALGKMDSLWFLSLSWSKDSGFTKIPASIGRLANLRELYLLGDSLLTVPAEIGDLANLEFLSLQLNRIAEIPARWGALTKLRELQIPHNRIATLPDTLFTLPALQKMDIANNRLCTLTEVQKTWLRARQADPDSALQTCP